MDGNVRHNMDGKVRHNMEHWLGFICTLYPFMCFVLKQHIPTLNGEIPEQKQDLPRPSSLITTKDEFFKMPMYKDIDSYILQVISIVSSDC